ncbi:pyridoxal phosphate-dependent aminotransferase [Gordonia rubripertincta]|uniref:Pyridoxal phosphate-dependent aminotransferase n=1 Tax=Gordonia rubripertincta TaxID=36822 RepID=A0ABT4MWV0_GORRU|nr:pyridoxal phosphate-dependent aminotransferase [Gordonia rubripertincta]MCZ4551474.1 pyridoxal phosphate-dependent aminotransferase [Gordonia rubripertincta]
MLNRLPALSFSERVARVAREGALIPVCGVPVVPMPIHVVEAASMAAGQVFARRTRGALDLRRAIGGALETAHGLSVEAETELLITHGAQHGMSVALRALLEAGDEVVVPAPTYFFDGVIRMAGATPRYVCSTAAAGWTIDLEQVRAAITGRTKAIVLCNPNNPTGDVPTAEVLKGIASLADEYGLIVFSDESYERYVHDGPGYTPLQAVSGDRDLLVTVTSLSKNYAFSSWRIGYVQSSPAVIARIHAALEWDVINVGDVPQAAATAVLTGPQEWLDVEFATMKARRDLLHSRLRDAEIPVVLPQAGIFMFADLAATGRRGVELENFLLDAGIIALSGGGFFGPDTHVRLLYGASMSDVAALGTRTAQTVASARSDVRSR